MRENKKTRKFRRLLSLLLAVLLVVGMIPVKSTLAVEPETTMETEASTESPETEGNTENSAIEDNTESPETEAISKSTPHKAVTPLPSAETTESTEPGSVPEETGTTYTNSVSGLLWYDENEDGVKDSEEVPVGDFPVYLYLEGDTNNAIQNITTDANGKYEFANIEPGSYVVGIKSETVKGMEYLLPLGGIAGDNKFAIDTSEWIYAYTKPIEVQADSEITGMDAGLRTSPGIQPLAGPYVDEIDVGAATTAITISTSGTYRLYGTTTSNTRYITVATGVTATFDLDGVSMTCSTSPIRLSSTANVTLVLMDGKTNTFRCTGISSSVGLIQAGIYVPSSTNLTIKAETAAETGILDVTGGAYSSGIGGYYATSTAANYAQNAAGTITIEGGMVTATGGNNGAGIGGSFNGDGGTITINGGTITTTSNGGAGIGGGAGGAGGAIVINDGTVKATGNSGSAGIGGGYGNGSGGNGPNGIGGGGIVTINGGTVTALGGTTGGAGIGGGSSTNATVAYGGTITINNGIVTATGGGGGAGIGGGRGGATGGSGGIITINGGTIIAAGVASSGGAGIGGGYGNSSGATGGSGGTINITGGTITANGGQCSTGIGGANGVNNGGGGGTITISGGTIVATGGVRASGIGGAGALGSGNLAGGAGTITITGGRVTATGGPQNAVDSYYAGGIGGAVHGTGVGRNTTGTIIFIGGSIYPSTYYGVVGDNAVVPSPRNGTANGNDTVHMVQFSGYSDNAPFYIVAGGSLRSYDYYANAHPAGIVYPWLIYPGVLTLDATNITASTADLNGEAYLVGSGYTITSGYFQVTTISDDYTSPVKTELITPTTTSTSGVVDSYSAGTTGLSADTTYYYRFVIVTGGTTIYGNEVSFRTPSAITEHYLKISDGSTLQSTTSGYATIGSTFAGSTGNPPATLVSGVDTYTYIGYRVGSTTATLTSGNPSFSVTGSTDVYYYYAGPPIVSVSHTGASGTTATLNGTYDLNGGTFTGGYFEIFDGTSWITLTSTSSISITSATGVTASTGQVDNSTTTPSITISGLTPGTTYPYRFTVTTNVGSDTATGSFTAGFAVTEKFVNLSGTPVDATGLPDNTVPVSSSYTATGIPTSHLVGSDTYKYLGYKLDSYTSGDTLTSGTPSSVAITGNRNVYYIYTKAEGSIKIEKLNSGGQGLPGAKFQIDKLTASGGTVDPSFAVQTGTTDGNGVYTFANLPVGIYLITEIEAPTGYSLLTESFEAVIPFERVYSATDTPEPGYLYSATNTITGEVTCFYYDITFTVTDQAELKMPTAGNNGFLSQYYLWIGLTILLAAGGTFVYGRKRRWS